MARDEARHGKEVSFMKQYPKILFVILSVILLLSVVGCRNNTIKQGTDQRVSVAIESLENKWKECYAELEEIQETHIEDWHVQILHTRIVNITEELDTTDWKEHQDIFEGIDYIVEFELLTNYLGTSPYYMNTKIFDSVIVYRDGTIKVTNNRFKHYSAITFSNDFSAIIESVEDFGSEYNQILDLK